MMKAGKSSYRTLQVKLFPNPTTIQSEAMEKADKVCKYLNWMKSTLWHEFLKGDSNNKMQNIIIGLNFLKKYFAHDLKS